jgi:hypothetical protein
MKLRKVNFCMSLTQEPVPGQFDAGLFPAGADQLQKGDEYVHYALS